MRPQIIIRSLLFVTCLQGAKPCGPNLCFIWKVTSDNLTLTCRADILHFRVLIYNQYNKLQAYCLPPDTEEQCTSYIKTGFIRQNIKTKETTFTITGNVSSNLNGNWTCKHGSSGDVAMVEVTIFKNKGNWKNNLKKDTRLNNGLNNTSSSGSDECESRNLLVPLSSLFGVTILVVVLTIFIPKLSNMIDDGAKKIRCIDEKTRIFQVIQTVVPAAINLGFIIVVIQVRSWCKGLLPMISIGVIIGLINGAIACNICHRQKDGENEGKQTDTESSTTPLQGLNNG